MKIKADLIHQIVIENQKLEQAETKHSKHDSRIEARNKKKLEKQRQIRNKNEKQKWNCKQKQKCKQKWKRKQKQKIEMIQKNRNN